MAENTNFLVQNKRLLFIAAAAVAIMLVPLIVMQFSNGADWSAFDFAVLGTLVLTTGFALELSMRAFRKSEHKGLIGTAVALGAVLIWIELGVGLIGTPLAGS